MDSSPFDRFSKLFGQRQLNRRDALRAGGATLAATTLGLGGSATISAAQDATPVAENPASRDPEMLFVQSYQSGSIAPIDGVEGRYTLTLEQGHGQTIYFSDRPDRIVGAQETEDFLERLGFPDDNPPNAALVVARDADNIDVAVIELFNPVYDADSAGITYEIEVLANWEAEVDMEFGEAPVNPAAFQSSFGNANLFIDGILDCPDGTMYCRHDGNIVGQIANEDHDGFCQSWLFPPTCLPCSPWMSTGVVSYWNDQCNQRFDACQGECKVTEWCHTGRDCPW